MALKRNIEAYVDKIHTMRVAKFFSKTAVRKLDRQPNAELMEIFGEILAKRLPNSLIDLEVKPQMILKSGGVLREFIRIADRSCNQCMTELRRQIRRQEFDKPLVKIDRRILDTVLTDLQLEYAEPLGQKDYDLLVQLYREMKPQDAENQRFLDLFHGLYVLEYRNAQLWYDLNPIVADLLRQEDSLDISPPDFRAAEFDEPLPPNPSLLQGEGGIFKSRRGITEPELNSLLLEGEGLGERLSLRQHNDLGNCDSLPSPRRRGVGGEVKSSTTEGITL